MRFFLWPLILACSVHAETICRIEIPPEVSFTYEDVKGIGKEDGVCRRDPSDVIKVGDTFYVWYSKVYKGSPLYPSGYYATVWYATSKDEGHTWIEKGEAVGKGLEGSFDSYAVFTPNILSYQGKYYLYYTAVANGFDNQNYSDINKTKIGVAESDFPDGPWRKPANNIVIEPSLDHSKFDSFRCDDSCLIVRDGKVWLYYKGRQWSKTPRQTRMGIAVANNPLGLFRKLNDGNPVQDSGHEVMVWPYQGGVMSLASNVGPHGRSLFYAEDGVSFKVTREGLNKLPIAPGAYREDLSGRPADDNGFEWGISMDGRGTWHLVRYECNLRKVSHKIDIPTPTPPQLAWQQAELGVVFHYDLHIFDDKHYNQGHNQIVPCADINMFNPTQLDTDQWIRTAKELGAKFAILTASHETGFRLWLSDVNPYSVKSVKWGGGKRDIVREFIDSCKKYDIKPGIYMGTRFNSHLGIYVFKVTDRSTITQQQYNDLIEKEVEEICSRYGDLFEIWFDGGAYGPDKGGPDVLSVFEKYQKNCLFYHNHDRADARWGGSESGTVSYPCWATMPKGFQKWPSSMLFANGFKLLKQGDPDGKVWAPAMSDAPLRGHGGHEWFWDKGDTHKLHPLKSLINMYYNSVGRNSTLILGLTPDNRGLIPDADVNRCQQFGRAIRGIFSNQLAKTSGKGNIVELNLPANSSFDHIVIQEDITHGERVADFKLEYLKDGQWNQLTTGTCIGHKRIIKIAPVTADKLRLTITGSKANPIIKMISAYNYQASEEPK